VHDDRKVLAVGCSKADVIRLQALVRVDVADHVEDAAARIAAGSPHAVVLGPKLSKVAALDLARRAKQRSLAVFVTAPRLLDTSENLDVFHVLPPELGVHETAALLRAATGLATPGVPRLPSAPSTDEARRLHRVLTAARALGVQSDMPGMTEEAAGGAARLTHADRAYCWLYDQSTGELWRHEPLQPIHEVHASRGLLGYVARTRSMVGVSNVGSDPRYHADNDDPYGDGDERWLAQPVIASDGEVHAVLVVVRSRRAPAFSEHDATDLRSFAVCCAPALEQLAKRIEVEAEIGDEERSPLFRGEAVDSHDNRAREGRVVRVTPHWVRYAYLAVLAFMAVLIAATSLGSIHEYSTGPAVIQVAGKREITARGPGTIERIEVEPGARVRGGQILARFYDASQDASRERLEREYGDALRQRMLRPDDEVVEQAVRRLASELEASAQVREETLVRVPAAVEDAVVGDVRVRTGQAVAPGELLVTLVTDASDLVVVAALPGADRPKLAPGQSLRLRIDGYPYAYADLVVESVGMEVVGPAELHRALGPLSESLAVAESSVIVRARLPSAEFSAGAHRYVYHDGMTALADVRLRRRTILETLVPGLEELR
jgi:multidrug efflux pump subunit AcrA (membrane-fusion protein)